MTENVKVGAPSPRSAHHASMPTATLGTEGSVIDASNNSSAEAEMKPGMNSDGVLVAASVAGNGWPVLALHRGTKKPTHGLSERPNHGDYWLTTPRQVVDANIDADRTGCENGLDVGYAVLTGIPGPDEMALVVLDVDGGLPALDQLLDDAGPEAREWVASTVRVERGDPTRGHLYGLAPAGRVPQTNGDLGGKHSALECRGLGGYVALPGSVHPCGRAYEITAGPVVVTDGDQPEHGLYDGVVLEGDRPVGVRWRVPLEIPDELLAILTDRCGVAGEDRPDVIPTGGFKLLKDWRPLPADEVDAARPAPAEPSDPGQLNRRVEGALRRLADAEPGNRNAMLFWSAKLCGAVSTQLPDMNTAELQKRLEDVYADLSTTGESAGDRRREAQRTVRSGWRTGASDPEEALADRRTGEVPALSVAESADTSENEVAQTMTERSETEPGEEPSTPRCRLFGTIGHDPLACPDCLEARDAARLIVRERRTRSAGLPTGDTLLLPGGSAILDTPADPVPVWGSGGPVLWSEGESLILLGVAGLGKTTLAQQLALGRCGVDGFSHLLGAAITPDGRRVLYLAMDRPRQAIRSLRRMVTDDDRALLDEKLRIWAGPPPVTLTDHPEKLAEMAADADAGTVIVDSLKDAGSVIDDEGGTGWNRARQLALAAGVQILELHHPRKLPDGQTMPKLEDAYGSTWLTAGAGSVLGLGGRPGDPVVKAQHLKQPADPWGPAEIRHDHARGRSFLVERADLVAHAAAHGALTVAEAATLMSGHRDPDKAEMATARRKLADLVGDGKLIRSAGRGTKGNPVTYRPVLRVV